MLDISSERQKSERSIRQVLTDLKLLVKGFVLVANALPIVSGFWLALYFTNTSLLANLELFFLTIVGGTLVMAGALIFNNWYEVDLDINMARTQQRPTVTGSFSLKTVLMMGIVTSVLGHIILLFTTFEAFVYAFLGWFTYVVLYTFWTKRRTTLNTIIGSISGAFTPLIGWAAITSAWHIVPVVLFLVLFIWQIPHTFAIAMRRHDEYKAANVPMLPVVYGFQMTKRQSLIYILCLLPMPLLLTSLGIPFIVLITLLNIGWIVLAVRGFNVKDDIQWANYMFYYSLTYLTVFFVGLIILTLPFSSIL